MVNNGDVDNCIGERGYGFLMHGCNLLDLSFVWVIILIVNAHRENHGADV